MVTDELEVNPLESEKYLKGGVSFLAIFWTQLIIFPWPLGSERPDLDKKSSKELKLFSNQDVYFYDRYDQGLALTSLQI